MAMTFIWKKQLVMLVTMLFVVLLGLTIGAFLHDTFGFGAVDPEVQSAQVGKPAKGGTGAAVNAHIQAPSLAFPTTEPEVSTPPAGALQTKMMKK